MSKTETTIFLVLVLLIGCSRAEITSHTTQQEIPTEINKPTEVYFCPKGNCENALINVINSSTKSIHCAFFDIDLNNLIKLLGKKSHSADVKLVVDDENYGAIKGPGVKKDTSAQYSHNKFCIIDGKIVTTGSFNPTFNDAYKNNNNLIILYSKYLAENYEDEFKELWKGDFGKGEKVRYPILYLNSHEIENYFCPEDECAKQIIEEIDKAEKSIYFMTFSFTHERIADAILFNKKAEIKGLFEKLSGTSKYSQYNRLKDFGLDVKVDKNPKNMHHKVFIIDNITVITGSFNPSLNAENRNDENILIIHDKDIAKRYIEEFQRLF